jgi:hypothetical protein
MKRLILILAILSLSWPFALAETDKWKVSKSTHFIVHYKNAQEKFVERLIEEAEDYYNKIADELGFRRYNFWLWDNRAKIYIYDNAQDYQSATGQPAWSSGCAMINEKIIYTFAYAHGFFDTTLPHEMGHIIFREFVGFNNYAVPRWLDEGVASYQEKGMRAIADKLVKEAIKNNNFINLERLTGMNPQLMSDTGLVNLFYMESLSLIDFLVKEYGSDNFVLFCQGLRDKQDLERAINYAYPFRNIKELDKGWQKYLTER